MVHKVFKFWAEVPYKNASSLGALVRNSGRFLRTEESC